jgi:hypothetical protein
LSRRADIWLGDLATAVRVLAPRDNRTRASVARVLGFDWSPERGLGRRSNDEARTMGAPAPAAERTPPPPASVPPPTPSTAKSDAIERILSPVRTDHDVLNRPWTAVEPLDVVTAEHLAPLGGHAPLLDPHAEREILFAATARSVPRGAVDATRIVSIVARGRPLTEVPRHLRLTIGAGVQVLLDAGPGMDPFQRDQAEFADLAKRIVGDDNVEVALFTGSPLRGVDSRDGPAEYRYPPSGRPVLLASDLGIGGPRVGAGSFAVKEWLRLLEELAVQGSRVVAFVPYPRSRWPRALAGRMVAIEWDRPTTVAAVRRAIEDAALP